MIEPTTAERISEAFRKLRDAWFARHLAARAPEREWEDEDEQERRESRNAAAKQLFDQQTEMILRGDDVPSHRVHPSCLHDLSR